MHLSRFLQSLNGTCRYCGDQPGLLHPDRRTCRKDVAGIISGPCAARARHPAPDYTLSVVAD